MEIIQLQVGCEPRNVRDVRLAVCDWLIARRVPQDMVEAVTLATHEAILNAFKHAQPCVGVTVAVRLSMHTVVVEVSDSGRLPWAFTATNEGMGHQLMTGLMTDVRALSGATGTTVRMSLCMA